MSHADEADRLLIKPAAGARPAPPRTRGRFIPKARRKRPVTRRVTSGTATTRLAWAPDRPTGRVLPSPEEAARTLPARVRNEWRTLHKRLRCVAPCGTIRSWMRVGLRHF